MAEPPGQHCTVGSSWCRTWTSTLLAWCGTRVALLALMLLPAERADLRDVDYYHDISLRVWCHGLLPGRDFSWEYPPGALPFAAPPLGCGSSSSYLLGYVSLALMVDLLVLLVLRALPRGPEAASVWLLLIPMLGPIALTRFDVSVCLLVALAFLAIQARPALGGALLTAAASVKLWPLILLVTLDKPVKSRALKGAIAAVITLALLFQLTGTLSAFRTAWQYQRERGLHVESLLALPYAWLRVAGVGRVSFDYGSWQVTAPGADAVAWAASALQVLLVAALLAVALRRRRAVPTGSPELALATVAVLVVSNKVLSPQYLLWIVVLLAVAAGTGNAVTRRVLVPAAVSVLATNLIYPPLYTGLLHGGVAAAIVLTVRDIALLLFAAEVVRAALSAPCLPATGPATRSRQPVLDGGST